MIRGIRNSDVDDVIAIWLDASVAAHDFVDRHFWQSKVGDMRDIYIPVYAGEYASAECAGRDKYTIDGKEYDECSFCRASCPSRDAFKEPDSGLPLKCDMCESDPPLEEPMCVKWCLNDALVYEEREEEVEEEEAPEEIEIGLESLANKHGWQKLMDTMARMSKKG